MIGLACVCVYVCIYIYVCVLKMQSNITDLIVVVVAYSTS